ncbi:hypothetical protein KR026_005324, partial [Drosophila bipectinata]
VHLAKILIYLINVVLLPDSIPKITIRNGDITVHGDCHGCNVKATRNSAHLSWKHTYTW